MSRRSWSAKQDQAVLTLVEKHGTKSWSIIAHQLSTIYKYKQRTGKQCRQRYHNHLDPKISKRTWTIEEQEIMFRMHKVYGNKWTLIAQQLEGRSDNTIKNHFYSTIRRSLRRMSKLVGEKNSTKQLKYIKPSTLSKIFAINIKPIQEEEVQQQRRKCEQSSSYKRLVCYLTEQCAQLTDVIMQFSVFKPKGKNCVIAQDKRWRFETVLQKMQRLNELYEQMRQEQRRLSSLYRPVLDEDDSDQQSQQNSMMEQQQQQKKISNKFNNHQNQKKQQKNYVYDEVIKKTTRSRRQIHPPKKYYQPADITSYKTIKLKQKQLYTAKNLKQQEKFNNNKKDSVINDNNQQQVNNNNQQQHNLNMTYNQPQFQLSLIHPSPSQLDHFPTPHLHLAQTPTYTLPTSFYINTPALQMYQTPPNVMSTNSGGLFSHIQGSWNIRNGQLDDMVMSLGSQIAKNTSQIRQKQKNDDGKTIISNINCSPNSAFRTCQ